MTPSPDAKPRSVASGPSRMGRELLAMGPDAPLYPPLSTLRVPRPFRSLAYLFGVNMPERVTYRTSVGVRSFGAPLEVAVGRGTVADVRVRCGRPGLKLTIGCWGGIVRPTVLLGDDTHHDVAAARLRKHLLGEEEPGEANSLTIGNDVWIGEEALLMGNAQIGDGAWVGARALVKQPVPPFAIAVGVPAKVIGYRFEPAEIALLQESKWWELPVSTMRDHIDVFYSRDVAAVAELCRKERRR